MSLEMRMVKLQEKGIAKKQHVEKEHVIPESGKKFVRL